MMCRSPTVLRGSANGRPTMRSAGPSQTSYRLPLTPRRLRRHGEVHRGCFADRSQLRPSFLSAPPNRTRRRRCRHSSSTLPPGRSRAIAGNCPAYLPTRRDGQPHHLSRALAVGPATWPRSGWREAAAVGVVGLPSAAESGATRTRAAGRRVGEAMVRRMFESRARPERAPPAGRREGGRRCRERTAGGVGADTGGRRTRADAIITQRACA